jgi:hypothetical protein
MRFPGFTAQTSLYRASRHYWADGAVVRAKMAGQLVTPAYPCACDDPNCQNPVTTTNCACDCKDCMPPPKPNRPCHVRGGWRWCGCDDGLGGPPYSGWVCGFCE